MVVVTCPCDVLYEQLQHIAQRSSRSSLKLNWLAVIRPDWFDGHYQMRSQVQTYLILSNSVATQQNNISIDKLTTFVVENFDLDTYGSQMIHLIMKDERWDLIQLFVKHERDWTFLNNHSLKVKRLVVLLNFIELYLVTNMVIYFDELFRRIFC